MRWWWPVVLLVLVVAGAAGGYAATQATQPEPAAFDGPAPAPASGPSYPHDREVRPLPPVDYPSLEPGLPAERQRIGSSPFAVSLRIPKGWTRSDATAGEARFYPEPYSDQIANTFFVRVRLVGNQYQTVQALLADRLAALQAAEDVAGFTLESRSYDQFVAHYVSGRHERVTMEQYAARPGDPYAFVYLAVVGREQDRDGLADLLDRMVSSLRYE